MGNSGYIGNGIPYAYHVHVTQFENGSTNINSKTDCVDPMHDLRLSNQTAPLSTRIRGRDFTPAIDLNQGANCEHHGTWQAFTPKYENNTRNVVEVEVSISGATPVAGKTDRYSNGFMNESLIEALVRKVGTSDLALIKGSQKFSKFRVDPRGAEEIYPNEAYGGTGEKGGGCSPYAYTSGIGFHPHDYYLFPDFYLRIHEDHDFGNKLKLADYPWDARYADGNYQIISRVTDIDDVTNTGTPVNFTIDNFKPFVREVGVNFEQVGVTAYWNKWYETAVPGQVKLGTRLEGGIPNLTPGPLAVYAIVSESMQAMTAEIPSLNSGVVQGILLDASINKWRFSFGDVSSQLAYNQCHKIIFKGQDLNNNQLLDFQVESPGIPSHCNWGITKKGTIPKRTGTNSWDANTASGQDEVHRFRIKEACTGFHSGDPQPDNNNNTDCEQLSQSISQSVQFAGPGQANGSITLTIPSSSGAVVTWYDVNRNQLGQGLSLANIPADWYCYELKEDCCVIADCIEVGSCVISVDLMPQHPSAPGTSDGAIVPLLAQGSEPFTYTWSNGATTATIDGLGVGTYSVTVTDVFQCSDAANVTLINCPTITVDANAIVTFPSACDAADGYINLLTNPVQGGVPPYSFHWKDGAGNIIAAGAPDLPNLAPGVYCLAAVDDLGCSGNKCYDLIPDHYPTLEEIILPACSGMSNGVLMLTAYSQLPGTYTFTWDDGTENSDDAYSQRDNLSAGTYCVTVTSEVNLCTVERCYEVPSVSPDGPITETHTIIHPCPNNANGQINLTVTGGVGPYRFDWSDLFALYPKDRNGLEAGTYTVTITDYCGTTLTQMFRLAPVSVLKMNTYPGCANQGQAQVTIDQETGNPPYSIAWSTGSNSYMAHNLASGEYCVNVSDANGCVTNRCIAVTNKEYSIAVIDACAGISEGVISLFISNPTEGEVTVHLDGAQVYTNLLAPSSFTVNIPYLASGTYAIDVSVEDCTYTTNVLVKAKPVEHLFHHYNSGDKTCVYNDACNGNIIPGSTTTLTPAFDLTNGSGGWLRKCTVPVYCAGVPSPVENKKVDKRWVKGAEYEQILLNANNFLFSQALIDSRIAFYYSTGFADCDNIKFCPANLQITSVVHTLMPNASAVSLGGGCFALDCTIFGNNNFCINDPGFFPPIFYEASNGGSIDEICQPASVNLYQLIVWENDLKAAYPDFESSDLYINYINFYRDDPRAKCARIVFCQSDFSVKWTNISSVNCDDYDGIIEEITNGALMQVDCGYTYTNLISNCDQYVCLEPHSTNLIFHLVSVDAESQGEDFYFYGHFGIICPEFPGHFFSGPGNNEYIKNTGSCSRGELVGLGQAVVEGRRFPKGIVKYGNVYNFMDYSINSRIDALEEIPTTEYLIDDWDSGQTILIRMIENEKIFAIDYHSDIEEWIRILASDVKLKISHFEEGNNDFVIGGEFSGNLFFNAVQVATGDLNTGFVIRVTHQGDLLGYNIVRNLDPQKPLVFVRGADGPYIVGRSTGQPVTVNGVAYQTQEGFLTEIKTAGTNGGTVVGNTLSLDSSLTVVRAQRSLDNTRVTYVLRGNGALRYGVQQILTDNPNDVILVTCDSLGNIIWTERIAGDLIAEQDFDIAYVAGRDVVIGITYSDTITVQGQVSTSNGDTDILFAKFNEAGQLTGMLNYGTSDAENVSKLFYADSILYFGGEFEGDITHRKIGAHTFLTISGTSGTPYISFITESAFIQEGGRGNTPSPEKNGKKPKSESISVYPNPFSANLTLRIESIEPVPVSCRVFDALGHLVAEQGYRTNVGVNEYSIPMLQYPKGMYLIQVLSETGNTWSQKVIKN